MVTRFITLVVLFFSVMTGVSAQGDTQDEDAEYRIVAYYTSWSIYGRQYFVTDVPADKLTHINYAFFNINQDGECVLGDPWADIQFPYPDEPADAPFQGNLLQLQLLRDANPNLQTLLSVGGWTWSSRFSDVALTEDSRQHFAQSCIALMTEYGFDGMDIDWEYPVSGGLNDGRPEDTENFTLLLAEFRRQLDELGAADGYYHPLTIAASAGEHTYSHTQLDQIHQYLDWINVMAYDFAGGWSETTNHQARLYASGNDPNAETSATADAAIQAYLAAGIPANKIMLGVPFNGRGWEKAPAEQNGLYQPFRYLPVGTWESGFFDYKDLVENYLETYTRYWDDEAKAAWLYNADEEIMISYEDPQTLQAKAGYVRELGLGGIMFWELSADTEDNALLTAIVDGLNE
jgi:chitinase